MNKSRKLTTAQGKEDKKVANAVRRPKKMIHVDLPPFLPQELARSLLPNKVGDRWADSYLTIREV
jgi:hypothetical protein